MAIIYRNMALEKSLSVEGFFLEETLAGDTLVIFTPVGRPVSVRVLPESGQTLFVEDSLSGRDVIMQDTGVWFPAQAGGLSEGIANKGVHFAYICPLRAIRVTGVGRVEVLA